MKSVFMVICDNGDGSHSIEWHKTMSVEKMDELEEEDCYQSGDGVQVTKLKFPDNFDFEEFAKVNYIRWYEDDAL